MNASKDKRKLVFAGCCTLSDDELAELYNLDLLTDEELASVSLERKSLIDDYRHLHELSMLRQQEEEREKERELERQREKAELERRRKIAEDAKKVTKIAKAVKLSSKAVAEKSDKQLPGGRKYGFQLLNQLIKKDFEMTQFSLYMEKEFEIFTDYHSDPAMPLLSAQEREKRRFWAHCDYLENLYCSGSCSRAMNIVVVALIRFSKSSLPTKASASKTRSRIPRPTTFHMYASAKLKDPNPNPNTPSKSASKITDPLVMDTIVSFSCFILFLKTEIRLCYSGFKEHEKNGA